MKTFEEAKKRYNEMMNDFGLEYLTIGERLSENTDNWNVRDMVSECQYQLDVCYEDDNANSEGRFPDYWEYDSTAILSEKRFRYITRHNENEKELHEEWLKKTRRLRSFIRKYKKHIEDIECTEGHCSMWD